MPGGSAYQGPSEALEQYLELVDGTAAEVKGAKIPYTSVNGHMFSFLTQDGSFALRLPEDAQSEFFERFDSGLVEQFGAVMRGYVSVPSDLFERTGEIRAWFERSLSWISTLPPK